jgi:hypothetical protein
MDTIGEGSLVLVTLVGMELDANNGIAVPFDGGGQGIFFRSTILIA